MKLFGKKTIQASIGRWQISIGVVLLLIILEVAGLGGVVSNLGGKIMRPAQNSSMRLIQNFLQVKNRVISLPKSTQKIQDLELRLAEASVSLSELDHLRKENKELRELLNDLGGDRGERFVAAPVMILARPSLSIGSMQGVVAGSMVSVKGVLLGRVSQVFNDYSQVELLVMKNTRPILVKTESGVEGIIRGDGKRVLLTEVGSADQLNSGERVMTVGQLDFPADLFVGRIIQIKDDVSASTQTAVLEQYASFYEASVVEVK